MAFFWRLVYDLFNLLCKFPFVFNILYITALQVQRKDVIKELPKPLPASVMSSMPNKEVEEEQEVKFSYQLSSLGSKEICQSFIYMKTGETISSTLVLLT